MLQFAPPMRYRYDPALQNLAQHYPTLHDLFMHYLTLDSSTNARIRAHLSCSNQTLDMVDQT